MIEEVAGAGLAEYGLLGLLFAMLIFAVRYLAKRDEDRDARLMTVIENNTVALTRFVESTKKCEVKR